MDDILTFEGSDLVSLADYLGVEFLNYITRVRVCQGPDWIKVKVNEQMWSPPLFATRVGS